VAITADAPADRLTIALTAKRLCWVWAMIDGQRTLERQLQPGEAQTIDVVRELVLSVGDGSAIDMTINGLDAKPLGTAGEVVTVRVGPANFRNFLQTR
jgi:hypothetical protein